MIKFKKIILIFLVLFTVPFISCSPGGPREENPDHISGVPFYEFRRFIYNDEQYEIFKANDALFIDNFDSTYGKIIKYNYHEYQKISDENLQTWTINYKQEVEKILADNYDDVDLIKKFYEEIENSILEYSILFKTELDYYESSHGFEKEFIIDMNNDFDSILVIDAYMPYKLLNTTNNEEYIFNVPIKSFLAYKKGDVMNVVFNDNILKFSYEEFISSLNVYK